MKHLLLLLIVPMILFSVPKQSYACEAHWYGYMGAGWTGNIGSSHTEWVGSDSLAAQLEFGYRKPINKYLWWASKISHDSHWFRGAPFNFKPESNVEHVNTGLEWRF